MARRRRRDRDEYEVEYVEYDDYDDGYDDGYVEEIIVHRDGDYSDCSRIVAGLLQIFLGALGLGRFYLGYTGVGVAMIVVSIFTAGVGGAIWGLVDGIRILTGEVDDAEGYPLRP